MNSIFTKQIFNFGIFYFKITIFMMQFVKHVLRVTLIELIVSLTVDRLAFPLKFLYFPIEGRVLFTVSSLFIVL